MKRIRKTKNYTGWYLLAFTLPLLIMFTILLMMGIYWGSDRTILASDGFHQYVIFNTTLRNTLQGDGSLFYTFTSGIGLNFYALISYYLGSFLSPFSYFFSLKTMPDALYLFTLLKFGLIGLSTFYSLHKLYNKLTPGFTASLSTSFSLMSFAVSQLEINMWLDVFMISPLIILGLHRLVKGEGRVLYYVSLTILFIQNYYFGYMVALFLVFWYLVEVSWDFKQRIKTFFDFAFVSILAGITSLIMILPTFLDLRTHGETLTKITSLQTENSWFLDVFAKNLIGSYDTTKFGAIPMIYVGLIPLLFALTFFSLKSIKWQVKLAYASLISIFLASFYLQALDLFWQGMHAPNMFLHRYAWLFSLLVILMAAESLSRFDEIKLANLFIPFITIIFGGLLTYFFKNRYPFLENIHFILTIEFLLAYFLILVAFLRQKLSRGQFALTLLLFSSFEIAINTHYQVSALANEWNFPSRENYEQNMTEISQLVTEAKSREDNFFRLERDLPQTGNDSMKYAYNGISQFSSIRNTTSSNLLDKLGFKSDGTNLNLRYQNNTLLMDAIFAIKYNIGEQLTPKFGFTEVSTSNHMKLQENTLAGQLALMTETPYEDIKLTNLTLDNQSNFINQISGQNLVYFNRVNPISSTNTVDMDNRVTVNPDVNFLSSENPSATYTFISPKDSQFYLSLPNLTFSNDEQKNVQIMVDNQVYNYTLDNAFAFFNVGFFTAGQEVTIRLIFPDNDQVSFDVPQFYALDLENFQTAMTAINSKEVTTTVEGNQVNTSYKAEKDTSLIYTMPYDQGWEAKINGKPVKVEAAQKGFIKIDVPKGQGKVQLTFTPRGFKIGVFAFFGGIITFFIYNHLSARKEKRPRVA